MDDVTKDSIVKGAMFAVILTAASIIPMIFVTNFTIYTIISTIAGIGILVALLIIGYNEGRVRGPKSAFRQGLIIGLIVAAINGLITPLVQAHSANYTEAMKEFLKSLNNGQSVSINTGFSIFAYVAGIVISALFYGVVEVIAGAIGHSKANKETTI